MSAAAAQSPAGVTRRRVPRYPVAVPVDVTVLRSGVPDTVPGRLLNVGEGGIAAVLAGELHPGDPVGVVLQLPGMGVALRAKAVVRHQARLRCGIEFQGIPREQLAMVRRWVQRTGAQVETRSPETLATEPALLDASSGSGQRSPRLRRLLWLALAVFVLVGGLGWWQWRQAWQELDSRGLGKSAASAQLRTRVPAGVMEQLVTHKVEPVYPDGARQAKIQGVVVLDAVIGRDGAMVEVRPESGPALLTPAAVDAVKWWRYQPYRVNGEAVEVETTVAVEFRPD